MSNTFPEKRLLGLPLDFTLTSLWVSSILKMEAIFSSEKSTGFHWATWRYVPENIILCKYRCVNYRSEAHEGLGNMHWI
jgi:hypothetical protein